MQDAGIGLLPSRSALVGGDHRGSCISGPQDEIYTCYSCQSFLTTWAGAGMIIFIVTLFSTCSLGNGYVLLQ